MPEPVMQMMPNAAVKSKDPNQGGWAVVHKKGEIVKIKNLILSVVAINVAGVAMAQEMFDIPGNSVDRRFQIASMYFGDHQVQMYSRLDENDSVLSIHIVSDVNCKDRTIRSLFQGNNAPSSFPMRSDTGLLETIEPNSDTERLARHACEKHGFSLAD